MNRRIALTAFAFAAAFVIGCESQEQLTETVLPPPWQPGDCRATTAASAPVRREGGRLVLEGRPFRMVGVNLYYLQQMLSYDEQGMAGGGQAIEALDAAACLGLSVVRAPAFNDYAAPERSSIRHGPGLFREEGLRGLDRAVAEAKKRGLRLVLSLTNNWGDYGGLPAYLAWMGRPKEQHDDFFADEAVRAHWKEHASTLLARTNPLTGIAYRDEPAILAWEIGNELRCESCRGSRRYAETIGELARFLKGQGASQLIADGGDGLDDEPSAYSGLSNTYAVRGDAGASFTQLLAIPELDLVSYHFYPDKLGLTRPRDAEIWIDSHERRAQAIGKVAYLGEFGRQAPDSDEARALAFQGWLTRLFDRNAGTLALGWQLVGPSRVGAAEREYAFVAGVDLATLGVLAAWSTRLAAP